MTTITKECLTKIIEAVDEVLSALAGTNDDVHPDDSKKMCELWDDLNDRYAPPEVVKELARMLLASMGSAQEPVAFRWRWKADEDSGAGRWTYIEPDYFDKVAKLLADDSAEGSYAFDAPQPLTKAERAELQEYRKAASEAVAWLWSHRKHKSEVTLTRPEDDERAEAALWGGWTCQPLAPVRPAPIGNEFIPKNLDRALGVLGMALPESKEEFYLQSERWIQRLIDRVIRYSDEFKAQPAPLEPIWAATKYPVSRPVPGAQLIVWDETGNFIGYGSSVDTRDSGVAIQMNDGRRLDSNHDLRWQYALQPAPVIPDGWVMLPAEPTQAMMNAWLSEVANWRGHAAGYRAMIAAAPLQEVNNG